jgi:hypothetical protein
MQVRNRSYSLIAAGTLASLLSVATGADPGNVQVWAGKGTAYSPDRIEEQFTYTVESESEQLNLMRVRLTSTVTRDDTGETALNECIIEHFPSGRFVMTCESDDGETSSGEGVGIGSMTQTVIERDDGVMIRAAVAVDDGGERRRVIRTVFNADGSVRMYNRTSYEFVEGKISQNSNLHFYSPSDLGVTGHAP